MWTPLAEWLNRQLGKKNETPRAASIHAEAVGIRQAGLYLLDVQADGNWSINVGQ